MARFPDNTTPIPPALLLQAYSEGLFPMAMENGELGWFSPDPRGVIPIREFHIPHGLRRVLKNSPFEVRVNTAFSEVMLGCAARETTWISGVIHASYTALHRLGRAHSVEVWRDGVLAGGLYGVSIGGAFFGESMFSRQPNASKIALAALVRRLDEQGFTLLDTQWVTEHLRQFGAIEIPRPAYLRRLKLAITKECEFV